MNMMTYAMLTLGCSALAMVITISIPTLVVYLSVKECSSNPCQHNGSCNDGNDIYTCTCNHGYIGVNCEIDINECSRDPCQHGGTCNDGIGNYTCTCISGYTGTDCETDVSECSSDPCQHGDSCKDGIGNYTCICFSGYTGTDCESDISECSSNPCHHGGSCNDGTNNYKCICISGYTGTDCETDVNECSSNPCQHGASCKDGISIYTCKCISGYTGIDCETDIDECSSSPCQNGGTCVDRINSFVCSCVAGYSGPLCKIGVRNASFYPFGFSHTNDQLGPEDDDQALSVDISLDLIFFGYRSNRLYITPNGVIVFMQNTDKFVPVPFPIEGLIGFAPYWMDLNTEEGGFIFYREELNATILGEISKDIRAHFPLYRSYSSIWALIVTYNNVRAFQCAIECGKTCADVVNFQVILSSDGNNTFIIFLYDRLDITAGNANCVAYAQIGFNAGDGVRFYMMPFSNTAGISNYALTHSNVNIPGKWMFSVSERITSAGP